MKSSEQLTNATFIIRFKWEQRGSGDGARQWRAQLLHVESREQFHGRTHDQLRAIFERFGFTDITQTAPGIWRRIAAGIRRLLRAQRRNGSGRPPADIR